MKKLLTCIAMGFATTSYAVTPLWMRDVQISPDGTEIAFCYKGDIYKVPANGGTATQLTNALHRHNLPPKHRMNARQSGLRTENKSLSPAIVTAISIYS